MANEVKQAKTNQKDRKQGFSVRSQVIITALLRHTITELFGNGTYEFFHEHYLISVTDKCRKAPIVVTDIWNGSDKEVDSLGELRGVLSFDITHRHMRGKEGEDFDYADTDYHGIFTSLLAAACHVRWAQLKDELDEEFTTAKVSNWNSTSWSSDAMVSVLDNRGEITTNKPEGSNRYHITGWRGFGAAVEQALVGPTAELRKELDGCPRRVRKDKKEESISSKRFSVEDGSKEMRAVVLALHRLGEPGAKVLAKMCKKLPEASAYLEFLTQEVKAA